MRSQATKLVATDTPLSRTIQPQRAVVAQLAAVAQQQLLALRVRPQRAQLERAQCRIKRMPAQSGDSVSAPT